MNSELQNIGPVSTFELGKLREFFETNKITFETEIDSPLKAEADRQLALHGNGDYDPISRRVINTFDYNNARFFFVYLKSEDALKAKAFLHQLSLSLNRENVGITEETAEELLSAEDYLCLDCDYQSLNPGACPEHSKPLLPYFDWVRAKKEQVRDEPIAKFFGLIGDHFLLIMAVTIFGYLILLFIRK